MDYYVQDGKPTGEVGNLKDAMRPLRTLYGLTDACEFGPKALKLVRQYMIDQENLSRGVINGRIDRLKRAFKWAVSEELIPPAIYEALRTVSGLRYGRSNAREPEAVRPVQDDVVEATLPFLPPQLRDMVRLQRITGLRSQNLVMMRPSELDRSANVWVYEPERHKTRHHNKRLRVLIGPRGQEILRPYLDRSPDAFLFSPQEAERWRNEQREANPKERTTPRYPSEARRLQQEQKDRQRRQRKRPPSDHYTTASYRRAIKYAVDKGRQAGVDLPDWHPHQLRHARATEVRRKFGVEGAQLALGHAKANITEIYAERDLDFGKRIARKTG
jgi:integrase